MLIRTCPSCKAKNRIPGKHVANTGRCGSCKATMPPVSEPIEADPALFTEITKSVRVPVLVDFWASWCAPCRMAVPEVKALAKEMAGRAVILKVDTEAHPELASAFRVQSIPNFVIFRGGAVVLQTAGLARRAEMRQWLENAGASAPAA